MRGIKAPREVKYCQCGCGFSKEVMFNSKWKTKRGHNFRIVHSRWNKGLTKETDKRVRNNGISIAKALIYNKGKTLEEIYGKEKGLKIRIKIKESHNTDKYRQWDSEFHKGKNNPMYGRINETHPNWKGGITPLNRRIRGTYLYREWREKVFQRDNWTCQMCNNRGGFLHPHHIKSFSKFPELRFKLSNGITLHKDCHILLHHLLRNTFNILKEADK